MQVRNDFIRVLEFHDLCGPQACPPSRLGDHVPARPHRHQGIRHLRGPQANQFVPLLFVLPEFEHVAQDGHFAAFQFGQ